MEKLGISRKRARNIKQAEKRKKHYYICTVESGNQSFCRSLIVNHRIVSSESQDGLIKFMSKQIGMDVGDFMLTFLVYLGAV